MEFSIKNVKGLLAVQLLRVPVFKRIGKTNKYKCEFSYNFSENKMNLGRSFIHLYNERICPT